MYGTFSYDGNFEVTDTIDHSANMYHDTQQTYSSLEGVITF